MNPAGSVQERQFFNSYDWCLNPALTLRELFLRLHEEIQKYDALDVAWQREECRINLYLFTCAIACTMDDWMAPRWLNLTPISTHFRRLKPLVDLAQGAIDSACTLERSFWPLWMGRWRRQWNDCVELACLILEAPERSSEETLLSNLRAQSQELLKARFPEKLLTMRMRVPEAFRCQDMTHQDVIFLTRRFLSSSQGAQKPLAVIGIRTAGAYFAPLTKAFLSSQGWPQVECFTIRPRKGLSFLERRRLRDVSRRGMRVLLVDDYQNRGRTMRMALGTLRRFNIPPQNITVLAPRHPAQPDGSLPAEIEGVERIAVIELRFDELHKAQRLQSDLAESLCREYYGTTPGLKVVGTRDEAAERINKGFSLRYGDSFQVRLKAVSAVRLSEEGSPDVLKRVLSKSVGWGWLGYHAYLAGTRLGHRVPKVLGLREGFLWMEWIENDRWEGQTLEKSATVTFIASYVASRARHLRLPEDPCLDNSNYRWTGRDLLMDTLLGVYNPWVKRFKRPRLRRRFNGLRGVLPALLDGQMNPEEWILTSSGLCKTDFEQHNFGGGELDLVDPAYDLAAAVYEFQLSESEEHNLLRQYADESSDTTVPERMLFYKLLCGARGKMRSAYNILSYEKRTGAEAAAKRREWHRSSLAANDFMVYQMNRFCGGLLGPTAVRWSKLLFFMDLDGVLDQWLMGFPHTTWSGLRALALLRRHGISVVPNTGRSVEHVRDYVRSYGFPGGIAEYGSVFVDAAGQKEMVLIDAQAREQLDRCREAIQDLAGVVIDPGYRFSVRAFRCNGVRAEGLPAEEVRDFLTRSGFHRLGFITTEVDTYIFQAGVSKESALRAVKEYLGLMDSPVAAIGDSDHDLGMLQAAEFPYIPAHGSKKLRRASGTSGPWRVMAEPFQRGLLSAARDLVQNRFKTSADNQDDPLSEQNRDGLMAELLQAPDRSLPAQIFSKKGL